jgi:hypothetical protein
MGARRRCRRPGSAGLTVLGHPITEAEFSRMLESFSHSAWRLETYDTYHLDYEATDFQQFLAGRSAPPTEISWWRPWLDMVTAMTREGKRVGRVRILAEPPTDYQRWELWAAPWHAQAGEQIGYLTRTQANALGLPTRYDWWLLDEQAVIVMRFDETGRIAGKDLVTDPGIVAEHREWRDLAVRHAVPAEEFTAA